MHTIGEVAQATEREIIDILGQAHGHAVHRHALGIDTRELEPERDAKSVSAEETFADDLPDRRVLTEHAHRMAARVVERIGRDGMCARTVTIKVRSYDFATITRSLTFDQPTDSLRKIMAGIRQLLDAVDVHDGIRLLGVGVAGLTDFAQTDLLADLVEADVAGTATEGVADTDGIGVAGTATEGVADADGIGVGGGAVTGSGAPGADLAAPGALPPGPSAPGPASASEPVDLFGPAGSTNGVDPVTAPSVQARGSGHDDREATGFGWAAQTIEVEPVDAPRQWRPGQDVAHPRFGPGWVQGAGLGRVTVRFEGPHTRPGPVRTLRADDPLLTPADPPVW